MIFFLKIPLSSIISNILGQNDEKLHTFHGDFDEAGNVLDWLGVDCVDDGYVVLHDAVDCLQQIDRWINIKIDDYLYILYTFTSL